MGNPKKWGQCTLKCIDWPNLSQYTKLKYIVQSQECAVKCAVLLCRSAIGNPIPLGAWDGHGGGGTGMDRAQQCYQIAILYRTIYMYLNIVFKYCIVNVARLYMPDKSLVLMKGQIDFNLFLN